MTADQEAAKAAEATQRISAKRRTLSERDWLIHQIADAVTLEQLYPGTMPAMFTYRRDGRLVHVQVSVEDVP